MEKIQLRGARDRAGEERKFPRRGEGRAREREPECIAKKKRRELEDMREAREA